MNCRKGKNKRWSIDRKLKRSKQFKKLYKLGIKMGFNKKNKIWKLRKTEMYSERNPHWYGNKVGYNGIHSWVKRRKIKPKFCECCHKPNLLDLANISGKYKRDINDFEWLCRRCHMKKDGRLNNLRKHIKYTRRKRWKINN